MPKADLQSAPRRRIPPSAWPVLAWTVLFGAMLSLQYAARRIAPSKNPGLLDGWVQFDGPEYLSIAADGYQRRQLVWFPVYPLLVRLADGVLGEPVVAAVLVSAAAGAASVVLFWYWTVQQGFSTSTQVWAVAVLMLYPYGWFLYGVVYSDAVFLAAGLGAFLLTERRHYWWAAAAGAVAAASRPSGLAVVAGLLVLALEREGVIRVPGASAGWANALRLPVVVDRSRWRGRSLVPALSVGGLLAVMAFQWRWWGSPIAFVTEQSNYHDTGMSSLLKQQYFEAWSQGFDGRHLATTTAQAVLLVVVIGSVPAVGRRFGWGYAVFVLGLAMLPAMSVSTFMGSGRYLLPAFPVFALWGEWLSRRRGLGLAVLAVSGVALAVMSAGFARSWYLT